MQRDGRSDVVLPSGVSTGPRRLSATEVPSWSLDAVALAEFELLATGIARPPRYLTAAELATASTTGRLPDGPVCALPLALDVSEEFAHALRPGGRVQLRDHEGVPLGIVHVVDVYAEDDGRTGRPRWRVGGPVDVLQPPTHHDFVSLRRDPQWIRAVMAERRLPPAVTYVASRVLHRPGLAALAAAAAGAPVLVLAAVGAAEATDWDHHLHVRCLAAAVDELPSPGGMLALTALDADHLGGWRGLLVRAAAAAAAGSPLLLMDDADLVAAHRSASAAGIDLESLLGDIGVRVEPLPRVAYAPSADRFLPVGSATADQVRVVEDADVEALIDQGAPVPSHLTVPAVVAERSRGLRPSASTGLTVFFTGLSGSGKSTIANVLAVRLLEAGRRVTLLDGDVVRTHLSAGLGFGRDDRDRNVRRIGFVAAEITKHGGTVVCAPIAPYDSTRKAVRDMVTAGGRFLLVHIATPLEVCEQRDRKGLYARARAGQLPEFTGVSDPYEPPKDADVVVDTRTESATAAADRILDVLRAEGLVAPLIER